MEERMIDVGFAFQDKVYMEFFSKGFQYEVQTNAFGSSVYDLLTAEPINEGNLKTASETYKEFIDYEQRNNFPDQWNDIIADGSFEEIFHDPNAMKGFTEGRNAWYQKEIMDTWIAMI